MNPPLPNYCLGRRVDLRQQLDAFKLIYGQKSEKTEVVLENGEQLSMFNRG